MKAVLYFILILASSALATESRRLHVAQEIYPAVSVQRTKDCPAGSELVGKQCVSTEVSQPNLSCPPGTALVNGECASFAPAKRVCPQGSTLSGDRCVNTQTIPASLVCDQGEITGTQCRVTSEVPPVCPAGLQSRDGLCVRFTAQQKVCSQGYQLQGSECFKQVSFPAAPVCPAEFSLIGADKCTKSVPVPPHCSFEFSLVNGECVKQVAQVAAPCPQGFSPAGDGCQRSQESPARPICPSGFSFDANKQCVQEIPVAPTCPAGTSRGSSGQCERSVAKLPVCDSGEELIGGRCKRSSLFSSELRCAGGYNLIHGKCKKVTSESPVPRCSSGVLKDNQCVTESPSSPLLQCPAGYQLAKGPKCIRDVSYDCSRTVVITECEMPAFVSEIGSLRSLHTDYKAKPLSAISYQDAGKTTPSKVTESKTPKCAPVKQIIPQTCTKAEAVPVQYICADGSAPFGKNCPIVASALTEPYCRAGQLDKATGQCVSINIQPANRVCPAGQLQPNGHCLQTDEKPAALVCPDGSQVTGEKDGSCVSVHPEVIHPNRVVRKSPEEVCDIGIKRGRVCVEVETIPRQMICPNGTEDRSGRCVSTAPLITPEPVIITQAAQYVCADGSSASGQSCFSREVIPAESVCLDGGAKEDSRCVHTADLIYPPARVSYSAARPICPPGFQQRGHQCTSISSQPADLQCPADFTRTGNGSQECVRQHERIAVCPAGTQETPSGCVKESYAPPRVTEVKICTKGQPGC